MNIFYLDTDIEKCARYHCDKHVVKMVLEYAQLLCTAVWLSGEAAPYRPTHLKHPCTLWVNASLSNWIWLKALARALNEQYRYRFDHTVNHRAWDVIESLKMPSLPDVGITERPQVMPTQYRIPNNPILAYRQLYLNEKQAFLHWRKVSAPEWIIS